MAIIKIYKYDVGIGKDYPVLINSDRIEDVEILDYLGEDFKTPSMARLTMFNGTKYEVGDECLKNVCDALGYTLNELKAV